MNYREYDRVQIELGGVAEGLKSDLDRILNLSTVDEPTKELVTQISARVADSISELSLLLSQFMRASTK